MEIDFITDVLLDENNICNMKEELKVLRQAVFHGKRLVINGLRNTGKTSLIKSVLIPEFEKKNKGAFVYFVDFMGVDSREDLSKRMRSIFEKAYAKSYPVKGILGESFDGFKTLRPVITTDSVDGISFSVTTNRGTEPDFVEIFSEIKNLAQKTPTLIVFDEFQDIIRVPTAEALFRDALQNLSHTIPIIILGSKKHILADIFAKPKAPFYNWGEDLEINPIDYEEYHKYMQERFRKYGLDISLETSKVIQDKMQRIPEPVNIICKTLASIHCGKKKLIQTKDVDSAILIAAEKRAKRFEQFLQFLAPSELHILIAISKNPHVKAMQGKDFVNYVGLSPAAVGKAQHYLEDESIIYKIKDFYMLTDPLMAVYLKHSR